MKHALRLIGLIILAFLLVSAGYFFEHFREYKPDAPALLLGFFSHSSHLFTFGGYALILVMVVEESIKYYALPFVKGFLRDEFLEGLFKELRDMRKTVSAVLREEGLIKLSPISTEEEKQDETVVKNIFELEMKSDHKLRKAESMVKRGNYTGAVEILEKLSKLDKKYLANLVTTLVFSPDIEHWKRAEEMLFNYPDLAEPEHYLRLAYKEWMNGNCESARRLAEKALDIVENSDMRTDEELEWRVKNSLAYYYADCELQDNAKKALTFATTSVQKILPKKDQSDTYRLAYARRLATLGYVQITFGNNKDEIASGIHDCEEARRLGASEELYFRHLARAQSRHESIRYQDQGS